ncbi:MAG: glycosyltransferase [Phycisphaerae bacterium]
MKIVVLAHNLRGAGGLVVGTNFIRALRYVASNHKYLIVYPSNVGYENIDLPNDTQFYAYDGESNLLKRLVYDCMFLPKIIKEFEPDYILALGNIGLTLPYKQAILFHQPQLVYPVVHWGKCSFRWKVFAGLLKRRLKACLKYTQLVFCQTPVTRERFAKEFNFPIAKIKIMPNAVSEFAKLDRAISVKPSVFNDQSHFNLFCLTAYYPHKNLDVLVEIFRRFPEKLKDVRCLITISPNQSQNAKKYLDKIDKYGLSEYIVNVGFLKQTDLANYYYNSDALILPTFLESFSGTYLEAMQFEVPILTSDLDFAHNICGDAALYFNPWSASEVVDKIILLKENIELRKTLVNNGKKQISTFFKGWEEITKDVIRELEDTFKS